MIYFHIVKLNVGKRWVIKFQHLYAFPSCSFSDPLFPQSASSLVCAMDFSKNVTSIKLWSQGKEKEVQMSISMR
jgi:hypothetical protein